jgi:hypothetical protein
MSEAGQSEAVTAFMPLALEAELVPAGSSQLSIGNRTTAGHSELLNCTVLVTVRELRDVS